MCCFGDLLHAVDWYLRMKIDTLAQGRCLMNKHGRSGIEEGVSGAGFRGLPTHIAGTWHNKLTHRHAHTEALS